MPKLPDDVEKLIDETIKLVDLIYWKPEIRPTPFHQEAAIAASAMDVDDDDDLEDIEIGMNAFEEEESLVSSGRLEKMRHCSNERNTCNTYCPVVVSHVLNGFADFISCF